LFAAVGDVTAAFQAALKNEIHIAKEGEVDVRQGLQKGGSIEDRAQALNSDIQEVASIAVEKVHDGLQFLTYVVLSTSLKK
jgi:aspartate 1-decarboxylase